MRFLLGAERDQLFLLEGLGFRIQDLGVEGLGVGICGIGSRI